MKQTLHLFSFIMLMAVMALCPQRLWALTDGWSACGTCEYLIDSDGLLTIRPVDNGIEGTLENNTNLFWENTSIKSVKFEGKVNSATLSCYEMFHGCSNITSIDFGSFNTSGAKSMCAMFDGCSSLTSLDLSNFDTSNTTNFQLMFYNCSSLTSLDLSSFSTDNVTNMYCMFYNCSSLTSLDLSSFNTCNTTNMYEMFYNCSSLTSIDLSNFSTANITDMSYMFANCSSLTSLDLSSFNTGNVTNMLYMFENCSSLTSLDLSSFDTGNVQYMYDMFKNCKSLTSLDLSNFNTSKVTSFAYMFYNCSHMTSLTIGNFDMSSSSSTSCMFDGTSKLDSVTVTVSTPPTLRGTIFPKNVVVYVPFDGYSAYTELWYWKYYTLNPIGWNISGTCVWQIIDGVLTIRPLSGTEGTLADQSGLFQNNTSIKSVTFEGNVNCTAYSCQYMFSGCSNITSIDFGNFNTSNATNMLYMFENCSSLTSLDLSSFNTSNVTSMSAMFYNCSSLTSLDLSSFNTGNVKDMLFMFENCSSLTSLDLSSFNTGNVVNMLRMFYDSGIKNLTLGNFDMQKVTYSDYMFTSSPNSITFTSYPYLADGTFNSLTSEVYVNLDDNSVCYTGENHFPTVKACKYTRRMNGSWGTLIVPFDVKYGSGNSNCELYSVMSVDDENITVMNYASGDIIPAGTPCIVERTNVEGNDICLEGVEDSEINTVVSDVIINNELTMKGSYTTLTDQSGIYYIASGKFWKATEAITIPAFRGWIATTATGFAKSLGIKVVDTADGIETVKSEESGTGSSSVYNILGQKISAPKKGQINILGGKKIFVK